MGTHGTGAMPSITFVGKAPNGSEWEVEIPIGNLTEDFEYDGPRRLRVVATGSAPITILNPGGLAQWLSNQQWVGDVLAQRKAVGIGLRTGDPSIRQLPNGFPIAISRLELAEAPWPPEVTTAVLGDVPNLFLIGQRGMPDLFNLSVNALKAAARSMSDPEGTFEYCDHLLLFLPADPFPHITPATPPPPVSMGIGYHQPPPMPVPRAPIASSLFTIDGYAAMQQTGQTHYYHHHHRHHPQHPPRPQPQPPQQMQQQQMQAQPRPQQPQHQQPPQQHQSQPQQQHHQQRPQGQGTRPAALGASASNEGMSPEEALIDYFINGTPSTAPPPPSSAIQPPTNTGAPHMDQQIYYFYHQGVQVPCMAYNGQFYPVMVGPVGYPPQLGAMPGAPPVNDPAALAMVAPSPSVPNRPVDPRLKHRQPEQPPSPSRRPSPGPPPRRDFQNRSLSPQRHYRRSPSVSPPPSTSRRVARRDSALEGSRSRSWSPSPGRRGRSPPMRGRSPSLSPPSFRRRQHRRSLSKSRSSSREPGHRQRGPSRSSSVDRAPPRHRQEGMRRRSPPRSPSPPEFDLSPRREKQRGSGHKPPVSRSPSPLGHGSLYKKEDMPVIRPQPPLAKLQSPQKQPHSPTFQKASSPKVRAPPSAGRGGRTEGGMDWSSEEEEERSGTQARGRSPPSQWSSRRGGRGRGWVGVRRGGKFGMSGPPSAGSPLQIRGRVISSEQGPRGHGTLHGRRGGHVDRRGSFSSFTSSSRSPSPARGSGFQKGGGGVDLLGPLRRRRTPPRSRSRSRSPSRGRGGSAADLIAADRYRPSLSRGRGGDESSVRRGGRERRKAGSEERGHKKTSPARRKDSPRKSLQSRSPSDSGSSASGLPVYGPVTKDRTLSQPAGSKQRTRILAKPQQEEGGAVRPSVSRRSPSPNRGSGEKETEEARRDRLNDERNKRLDAKRLAYDLARKEPRHQGTGGGGGSGRPRHDGRQRHRSPSRGRRSFTGARDDEEEEGGGSGRRPWDRVERGGGGGSDLRLRSFIGGREEHHHHRHRGRSSTDLRDEEETEEEEEGGGGGRSIAQRRKRGRGDREARSLSSGSERKIKERKRQKQRAKDLKRNARKKANKRRRHEEESDEERKRPRR